MELKNLTIIASKVITNVGGFIRDEFKNFDKNSIIVKGLNDLVSYVDKEAEEMLMEELALICPSAGFITEESQRNDNNEYNWIIDPLDGTTNFVHGVPLCSISVALIKNGNVQLGIVYDVLNDEIYSAWLGGGAYRNGEKIQISRTRTLANSLVALGFPVNNFTQMENYFSILGEMIKKSHGVRRLGSAALDLCYVACGRFELFYEYNLNSWDVAAGALIVQEAGGTVSDFEGDGDYIFGKEIMASNGHIHEEALGIVKTNWTGVTV